METGNRDDLLTLEDVRCHFPVRQGMLGEVRHLRAVDGVDLVLRPGQSLGLVGESGCGKSTFLKLLLGEEAGAGRVKFGPTVKWAYLPQIIHFEHPERTLLDTMLYEKNCTVQTARDRLGAYLFEGEDVFKTVSSLSGGEQSRLRLCMLMDEKINLLILDEPTNHLDLASREWVEDALEEYEGALLFVSHDRYFVDKFATRIWELENQTIRDFQYIPNGGLISRNTNLTPRTVSIINCRSDTPFEGLLTKILIFIDPLLT